MWSCLEIKIFSALNVPFHMGSHLVTSGSEIFSTGSLFDEGSHLVSSCGDKFYQEVFVLLHEAI